MTELIRILIADDHPVFRDGLRGLVERTADLVLPGEAYVEYQLLAQKMRPDSFVVCLGYGECGTGYVPTEKAVREKDGNLHDCCWVAPGAEKVLTSAIRKGLLG